MPRRQRRIARSIASPSPVASPPAASPVALAGCIALAGCPRRLHRGQYRTRDDDDLGELQLEAIARAVEQCRFTVLIASSVARWDKLAQFAAALAQHAGLEGGAPRLIIVARDFALASDVERSVLSLGQRALVGLDCSDDAHTVIAMARLRKLLASGASPEAPLEAAIDEPIDERPDCPYPGLARFTAANRDLLFGRDRDKDAILQRIRGSHTRILVVGPSGSGKSSLIHAAVVPELSPEDHVVQVVPPTPILGEPGAVPNERV